MLMRLWNKARGPVCAFYILLYGWFLPRSGQELRLSLCPLRRNTAIKQQGIRRRPGAAIIPAHLK